MTKQLLAAKLSVLSLAHSIGMCRFLCKWRCKEGKQLNRNWTFISKRVFKPDGDSYYLSISERHLRLIQCQDRIPSYDPDGFKLVSMMMTADLTAVWNLYNVDAGEWVV